MRGASVIDSVAGSALETWVAVSEEASGSDDFFSALPCGRPGFEVEDVAERGELLVVVVVGGMRRPGGGDMRGRRADRMNSSNYR